MKVPIEISARHFHATSDDYRKLFGDLEPKIVRQLSQKGQFASDKIATLETKGDIDLDVRFLGPFRKVTQVEITKTEAHELKIDPPIEESNVKHDAALATLVGSNGKVKAKMVIIAERHLHINSEKAFELGLKDGQFVSVSIPGDRATIFEKIIVRVNDFFTFDVHLDTDEANAADIESGTMGELII